MIFHPRLGGRHGSTFLLTSMPFQCVRRTETEAVGSLELRSIGVCTWADSSYAYVMLNGEIQTK